MVNQVRRAVRRTAPKPVSTDDPALKDLQRQVREMQTTECPFPGGVILEFVLLDPENPTGPASLMLKHGLGRTPVGWFLVDLVCPQVATIVNRGDWSPTHMQLVSERQCRGKVVVF